VTAFCLLNTRLSLLLPRCDTDAILLTDYRLLCCDSVVVTVVDYVVVVVVTVVVT
jgi:hypothetical protein